MSIVEVLRVVPMLCAPEGAHEAMRVRESPCWSKGRMLVQYVFNPLATGKLILGFKGEAEELIARTTPPKKRI